MADENVIVRNDADLVATDAAGSPDALVKTDSDGHLNASTLEAASAEVSGVFASGHQYATPTTGGSVAVANTANQLLLNPAGSLAALTVTLPAAPINGQRVGLASSKIVTTLTLSAVGGQTLVGAIAEFAADGFAAYQYHLATTTWFRVG